MSMGGVTSTMDGKSRLHRGMQCVRTAALAPAQQAVGEVVCCFRIKQLAASPHDIADDP
jgi:hypothetical protein